MNAKQIIATSLPISFGLLAYVNSWFYHFKLNTRSQGLCHRWYKVAILPKSGL